MGSYAISPFEHKAGWRMADAEESAPARWCAFNKPVLQGYWDDEIEYTEDAIERLQPIV